MPTQGKPNKKKGGYGGMTHDWRETTNAYAQQPDVVNRLKATAAKIVRTGRSTPGAVQKNDGPQLWPDLKADPGEKTNVIAAHPEVVAKLRATYD